MRDPDLQYRPFPDIDGRNWRQVHLEIPAMVALLGLPRGSRVLEVGCGRGIALPTLARLLRPHRLVGLDVDKSLLAAAARRLRAEGTCAELILGDIRDMPFPDASFDLVVDFGTCFHVARADLALQQVARVLVPGGTFVTETRLNQKLSHPVRSHGRRLPWMDAPDLLPRRWALFWESHQR